MSSSPQPVPRRAVSPSRGWRTALAPTCALATLLLTGPLPLGRASAALMPATAPASSEARGTLHEEILRLLESPESVPRAADWAPLGPDALTELLGLASDPQAPEPQRTRAVAAIAVVENPEATQSLQGLLASRATPDSVRAAATLALSRRAGLEALPLVTPLLTDRSEQVRATAARSLGRMGNAEARKALEERLPFEESLAVREAIQQGLTYLEP